MSEPQIITPQERRYVLTVVSAERALNLSFNGISQEDLRWWFYNLAHTVATEPDRIRAAVVKALKDAADNADGSRNAALLHGRADAIENGADW